MQSIAPGLVRTGLRARMMKQNIEEGMKELDSLCRGVSEFADTKIQDIMYFLVVALRQYYIITRVILMIKLLYSMK